jgi:hypothetical protein
MCVLSLGHKRCPSAMRSDSLPLRVAPLERHGGNPSTAGPDLLPRPSSAVPLASPRWRQPRPLKVARGSSRWTCEGRHGFVARGGVGVVRRRSGGVGRLLGAAALAGGRCELRVPHVAAGRIEPSSSSARVGRCHGSSALAGRGGGPGDAVVMADWRPNCTLARRSRGGHGFWARAQIRQSRVATERHRGWQAGQGAVALAGLQVRGGGVQQS